MSWRMARRVLPLAGLSTAIVVAAGVHAAPAADSRLNVCAAIELPGERLACYDQLAGRIPSKGGSAAASAPPLPSAPATPLAPAAAPAPTAPAASPDSFGLYTVEHPRAPKPPAAALSAKVAGLGSSAGGRVTVSLQDGQVWELDDADPLLTAGDLVTIRRAAFGSYLMTTRDGRTHRTHRLK
jgi:hypothetical protein